MKIIEETDGPAFISSLQNFCLEFLKCVTIHHAMIRMSQRFFRVVGQNIPLDFDRYYLCNNNLTTIGEIK